MTIETLHALFNLYKSLLVDEKIDTIDFGILSSALVQTANSETLKLELMNEVKDGSNC